MPLAVEIRAGLLVCCLLAAAAPGLAQDFLQDAPPRKPAAQDKKPSECVDVTTEAAFASVGYDHIVRLKSTCKATVTCSVKTDVNPDPATATLAPGESTSMVTWRGSPAREFKADVSCSAAGGAGR